MNIPIRLLVASVVMVACSFVFIIDIPSAKAECACSCYITKEGVEKKIDIGKVSSTLTPDASECLSQCDTYLQQNEGLNRDRDNYKYRTRCVPADTACWCKGPDGPYKKTETADVASCQAACKSVGSPGQEMAGFGNTPPTPPGAKGSAVSCPPGGDWTSTTCGEAKNSEGVKIGRWDPNTGKCFYNDAPIKLGIGLGSLTQANLAQYLSAAYNLSLGFAAVLAVIFIMIGGLRYLSAAGGPGVEQGKGMIKSAVIGLVLSALSYTLLLTVNPDILSLRLPTIMLIKACDIKPVDCGAYTKPEDCDKNTDPSKKCSWNHKESVCLDFSTTQSGTPGQLGSECKKESNGTYSCSVGACVGISSSEMKCSDGGPCQACVFDTDIDPATGEPRVDSGKQGQCRPDPGSGLPVKCISNKCAQINPNNPPTKTSFSNDNYISCTNTACSSDSQCPPNQKCNDKKLCIVANQGTSCIKDSDCRTQDGQKCVSFAQNGDVVSDQNLYWKKACCANGDGNGCLGCKPVDTYQGTDDNPACPKSMKCDPGTLKCIVR